MQQHTFMRGALILNACLGYAAIAVVATLLLTGELSLHRCALLLGSASLRLWQRNDGVHTQTGVDRPHATILNTVTSVLFVGCMADALALIFQLSSAKSP